LGWRYFVSRDRGEFQNVMEFFELASYSDEIVGNGGWYHVVGRYIKGGRIRIHGQ